MQKRKICAVIKSCTRLDFIRKIWYNKNNYNLKTEADRILWRYDKIQYKI
ncbi:MAG: hypothetical protein IJ642_00065 [Oscillospiraceae bacterium]|nr:hypothetical protein [Oscillospiraceae bacterium]